MQRVLVIGISVAGKTTLSRALAAHTGLPLIHLDCEYWLPDWKMPPREQWRAKARAVLARLAPAPAPTLAVN